MAGDREQDGKPSDGAEPARSAAGTAGLEVDLSTLPPPPVLPPPPGPDRPDAPSQGLSKGAMRLIVAGLVVSHLVGFVVMVAYFGFMFWKGPYSGAFSDPGCDDVDQLIEERATPPGPADVVVDPEVVLDLPPEWYGVQARDRTAAQLAAAMSDPSDGEHALEGSGFVEAQEVSWQGRDDAELMVVRATFDEAPGAADFDHYALRASCGGLDSAHPVDDDPWIVLRDTGDAGATQRVTVSWVAGAERWSVSAAGQSEDVSQGQAMELAGQLRRAQHEG
jgi:hypothetical protein